LGQRLPVVALEVIVSDDANVEELRLLLQLGYPGRCYNSF
jgi:hypothetical protein